MARQPIKQRILRFVMAVTVGGSAFALSSCDPAVRSTILTGMETTSNSIASTLISAFFISLNDDASDSSSLTTTP